MSVGRSDGRTGKARRADSDTASGVSFAVPWLAVPHHAVRQLLLQDTPPPVETGHDRPDRDVEDLRRVLVREVADVDQDDDIPEVVRHGRERIDGVILGQPSEDLLLLRVALGQRVGEAVVEVVVAFLERLRVRRALLARPRSMLRLVRIRINQARRFVPGVNDRQLRNARAYVS